MSLTTNDKLQFILGRRSIRVYAPGDIGEAAITQLLQAAMAAPSAVAKDPWRFIVIQKKETLATIKRVFDQTGRILDPHTAVAASAAGKLSPRPLVVLSTAHPAKFPDAVAQAIGRAPEVPEALARLAKLPETLDILPNKLPLLRQYISSKLAV